MARAEPRTSRRRWLSIERSSNAFTTLLLRAITLFAPLLLLYSRHSNCTVARRYLHDHRRTQPPPPPNRWRVRLSDRGFRAPVAGPRGRSRSDPFDAGWVQQLPRGRADRGSVRKRGLLDEWHRTARRRWGSACRAARPDLGAHDRRAGA